MTSTLFLAGGALLGIATAIVALAALYHWARAAVPAFLTFRGRRVITCPETGKPAGVEVDAVHAAQTAFRPHPDLRLSTCSRWPERRGCGEECLSQIEAAPADCLARGMLEHWYAGKRCAYCAKPFGAIHWHDHKPVLLNRDGRTLEWPDVPAEDVPESLASDQPVCWNCHVVETFRREHPELVIERPQLEAHRPERTH